MPTPTWTTSSLLDAVLNNGGATHIDAAVTTVDTELRDVLNRVRNKRSVRTVPSDVVRRAIRVAEAAGALDILDILSGDTRSGVAEAARHARANIVFNPQHEQHTVDHFNTLTTIGRLRWCSTLIDGTHRHYRFGSCIDDTIVDWLATVNLDELGETAAQHLTTLATMFDNRSPSSHSDERGHHSPKIATIIERLVNDPRTPPEHDSGWSKHLSALLHHKTHITVNELDWWIEHAPNSRRVRGSIETTGNYLPLDALDDDELDHLVRRLTDGTLTQRQQERIALIVVAAGREHAITSDLHPAVRTTITSSSGLLRAAAIAHTNEPVDNDHIRTLVERAIADDDIGRVPGSVAASRALDSEHRQKLAEHANPRALDDAASTLGPDDHDIAFDLVVGGYRNLNFGVHHRYHQYFSDPAFAERVHTEAANTPGIVAACATDTQHYIPADLVGHIAKQLIEAFGDNEARWGVASELAGTFPGTVDEFTRRVRALTNDTAPTKRAGRTRRNPAPAT